MYRSLLLLALATVLALPAAAQPALFTPADDARTALTARQAEVLGHLEASSEAVAVRLVHTDLDALDAAAVSFNLAPDATVALSRASAERRTYGVSYHFRSADDDGTFAMLVAREGQVTGNVRVRGQLFGIRPLTGGLHAVTRIDEGQLVDHAPEWEAVEARAAARWEETPFVPEAAAAPAGGDVVQRVLVPYTPNADSQVGDILALIQLAIDETNLAYDESDVSIEAVLAHAYMTPQNEGSFSTTLSRMQNPSDGFHDEIAGLRDEYGGDMVNMIAGSAGGLCGQARTILADGPDEAFSITAQNCTTGYYSFGHELGHLQGARHNPEADGSSSPFPYGHGKYYIPGGWRTVMSYACSGGSCTRVPRWSNPDVLYNGEPLGDAALRDNARVLDETALTVAAFYPDPDLGVASVEVTRLGPAALGAGGGPMPFSATVSASGDAFAGEAWVTATMPDGSDYGLLFGPLSVSLSDGQSVSRTLTARVPALAPEGTYTITVSVGASYPDEVEDSASFTFDKAAPLAGPPAGDATARWTVTLDEEFVDGVPAEAASAGVAGSADGLALLGTAPNPMTGTATVRYTLDAACTARVSVFDVLGREVAVLADGHHAAGRHAAVFAAQGLPSGVYVVRVQSDTPAGTAVATQRVTLAR